MSTKEEYMKKQLEEQRRQRDERSASVASQGRGGSSVAAKSQNTSVAPAKSSSVSFLDNPPLNSINGGGATSILTSKPSKTLNPNAEPYNMFADAAASSVPVNQGNSTLDSTFDSTIGQTTSAGGVTSTAFDPFTYAPDNSHVTGTYQATSTSQQQQPSMPQQQQQASFDEMFSRIVPGREFNHEQRWLSDHKELTNFSILQFPTWGNGVGIQGQQQQVVHTSISMLDWVVSQLMNRLKGNLMGISDYEMIGAILNSQAALYPFMAQHDNIVGGNVDKVVNGNIALTGNMQGVTREKLYSVGEDYFNLSTNGGMSTVPDTTNVNPWVQPNASTNGRTISSELQTRAVLPVGYSPDLTEDEVLDMQKKQLTANTDRWNGAVKSILKKQPKGKGKGASNSHTGATKSQILARKSAVPSAKSESSAKAESRNEEIMNRLQTRPLPRMSLAEEVAELNRRKQNGDNDFDLNDEDGDSDVEEVRPSRGMTKSDILSASTRAKSTSAARAEQEPVTTTRSYSIQSRRKDLTNVVNIIKDIDGTAVDGRRHSNISNDVRSVFQRYSEMENFASMFAFALVSYWGAIVEGKSPPSEVTKFFTTMKDDSPNNLYFMAEVHNFALACRSDKGATVAALLIESMPYPIIDAERDEYIPVADALIQAILSSHPNP